MGRDHMFEEFSAAVNSCDPSLSQSEKDLLVTKLARIKEVGINILIVGAAGSGKTSTAKVLVKLGQSSDEQAGGSAETGVVKFDCGCVTLYDSPGFGESFENDKVYTSAVIEKLTEIRSDVRRRIDLVLVVADASSRDLRTTCEVIRDIIVPHMDPKQQQILVAINQADMAMKGRFWSHAENRPASELVSFLDQKADSIRSRIKEGTGVDVRPIYYAAGYSDNYSEMQSNPYNVPELLLGILRTVKPFPSIDEFIPVIADTVKGFWRSYAKWFEITTGSKPNPVQHANFVLGAFFGNAQQADRSSSLDRAKAEVAYPIPTKPTEDQMDGNHITEEFAAAIESDPSLDETAKAQVLRNLTQIRKTRVNILIVGATGCGKSSTINALFNAKHATVGIGVDPETMAIGKYDYDNVTLYDSPGFGDSIEKDKLHAKNVIATLKEVTDDNCLLIDLVLVIVDGSSRDLGTTYQVVNDVILPNLGPDKGRILIAINQADVAMKGRFWDHAANQPEPELKKFLEEKVESVKKRIEEATKVDVQPICYAAGYSDRETGKQNPPYNLAKLLLHILRAVKEEKRVAIAQDVNNSARNWTFDDGESNYRAEVKQTLVQAVVSGVKQLYTSAKSAVVSGLSKVGRFFFGG